MSIQSIETSPLPIPRKKSPVKPTHYVSLKYSYLSEWWWREVPLKEWSHSKLPTKISKKPPARASLAVALISLLSTQDIPKCQLTVTFGNILDFWPLLHLAEDLAANDANKLMSIQKIFALLETYGHVQYSLHHVLIWLILPLMSSLDANLQWYLCTFSIDCHYERMLNRSWWWLFCWWWWRSQWRRWDLLVSW